MRQCYEFIENDSVDMIKILQSDTFQELKSKEIRRILKSDHLRIKEEILWKYMMKWAEYQSKITIIPQINNDIN